MRQMQLIALNSQLFGQVRLELVNSRKFELKVKRCSSSRLQRKVVAYTRPSAFVIIVSSTLTASGSVSAIRRPPLMGTQEVPEAGSVDAHVIIGKETTVVVKITSLHVHRVTRSSVESCLGTSKRSVTLLSLTNLLRTL